MISWNKPTGEICPECGDILVVKGTKTKRVACNNSECNYTKEYVEKESEE